MCDQSPIPAPSTDSPIMAIYRQWREAYAALHDMQDDDEANDRPHTYQSGDCKRLEAAMMALPCRDAKDFAAKLLAKSHFGDFCLDNRSASAIWAHAVDMMERHEIE